MSKTTAVLVLIGLLVLAVPVSADTLKISCPSCTPGSVTLISNGTPVSFGLINTSAQPLLGDAQLAVLEPLVSSFTGSVSFNAPVTGTTVKDVTFTSGTLGAALGLTGFTGYNFSNFVSASAQAGVIATSFLVRQINLNPDFLGAGGTSNLVTCCSATGLPNGTVIVAFLLNAAGQVTAQTPLSESVTVGVGVTTSVPEPTSLLLLGSGLAGMGLWQWRRRKDGDA